MKKLLIIQQDEAYFLFETLQVLEKYAHAFKNFDVTLLVNERAFHEVYENACPVLNGITWDQATVAQSQYDLSVNLSLNEASWHLHGEINSQDKIGAFTSAGQTVVKDLWSTYLMTLKAKAPFLTFHLQDVFRNILGIKSLHQEKPRKHNFKQMAFALCSTGFFPADEQEKLINEIARSFPQLELKDISEIDLITDLSQTLYLGPSSLKALKLCEAGGQGIFLTSNFQGFNLTPSGQEHLVVSSRNQPMTSSEVIKIVEKVLNGKKLTDSPYSLYQNDHENIFGTYLKCHNASDDNYPFYQAHVVLWNFLLNLFDVNLEITKCHPGQLKLLKIQQEALRKYLRLHDYALVSVDTIFRESKLSQANHAIINGHLNNLQDIDKIADQLAQSHSLLRPILDFYRIRRGQNAGTNLTEQAQESLLTYSEEHQALEALLELFSVTLKQNEVSI